MAAALTGLVGGLAWISVLVFDQVSDRPTVVDVLLWTGLLLLGAATLVAGASLVSRSAVWLQVLVSVCFVALVGSLVSLLTDSFDAETVYALVGAIAVIVSVVVLVRTERAPTGSHAR